MVTHQAGGYSLYLAERLLTGLYVAVVGLSAMMVIWILFVPASMLTGYEWHDTQFLNSYKHDVAFPGPVHISEIVREFLEFERRIARTTRSTCTTCTTAWSVVIRVEG